VGAPVSSWNLSAIHGDVVTVSTRGVVDELAVCCTPSAQPGRINGHPESRFDNIENVHLCHGQTEPTARSDQVPASRNVATHHCDVSTCSRQPAIEQRA
jgi:hypothetical protein